MDYESGDLVPCFFSVLSVHSVVILKTIHGIHRIHRIRVSSPHVSKGSTLPALILVRTKDASFNLLPSCSSYSVVALLLPLSRRNKNEQI